MNVSKHLRRAAYGLLLVLISVESFAKTPKVVVSIAPIHSLVSQVMLGVDEPLLLIEGGQSPHNHNLKPSSLRKISAADLIIRVGPDFEFGLDKPIASIRRSVAVIDLIAIPQLHILPHRDRASWQREIELDLVHTKTDDHDDWLIDPHIWLSSENAKIIIDAVRHKLIQIDPDNASQYQSNSAQAIDNVDELAKALKKKLAPVRKLPYMVFHDAYQYFEAQFDLNAVAAVTLKPESLPGAKTLDLIAREIDKQKISCLFHEPQFQARLVKRIVEINNLQTSELDPVGAALTPGPALWHRLMTNLSSSLVGCLARP